MTSKDDDFRDFDPHRKDIRVGAECLWARMRETEQLPRSEQLGGFRIVSRYADLKEALLSDKIYSSASGITIPEAHVRTRHIPSEIDPPLHGAYRALMSRFLTNDKVKLMEPGIRALVISLLDAFRQRSHVDFVAVFARPLPVHVSLQLLNLPPEDAQLLDSLVIELHAEVATGVKTGASQKLAEYVERSLIARRATANNADDDMMSSILLGLVDSRRLTLEEQVSMVRQVLIGGFDSTSIALATAVWWLAEHPQDAQRLRDTPKLIDKASEEIVRFASPASYLRRTVTKDVALGGTQLHEGDWVVLAFGAANRDPNVFECPDQVVLDRSPNHHLGFGSGVHRCIGSFLAKLEMRVALEEILRRYREIKLDTSQPIQYCSGLNQGIMALPVILTAA
jgi:cytochrome P450